MNKHFFTAITAVVMLAALLGFARAGELTVKALPPSVVKTSPQCGKTKVPVSTRQIKVSFSKKMKDKSWSFVQLSPDSFPEVVGKPKYLPDGRTCVLTVKLKPKKTYVIWINSQKLHGFVDADGSPAVPYLLTFQTQ